MPSLLQEIYWKAPYFIKNWMASIKAGKLDKWRFGKDFEQICTELKERQNWSAEQFAEYQSSQLSAIIQHVAAKVPYYRKLFAEEGIDPASIKTPENLSRIPILEKETVRQNPLSLVDETLDISKLYCGCTSGTTGTPLNIYRDKMLSSLAFAYIDIRCHAVAGMYRRINPSVSIGGHLVTSPKRNKPPFWVENRRWKQLYMSSYHLSPNYLGTYVDKIRNFKPEYIEGYPSSIHAVAKYIVDKNLEPIELKAAFTTAEMLYDYQRQDIEKAFLCHTYNQYGCGELVVFASECEAGNMHLSPEIGIVEVVGDDDKPLPKGQPGQLICTSLVGFTQPLIRYRMGDVAALSEDKSCSCGSHRPILMDICGREDDLIYSTERGAIGSAGLSTIFYSTSGVFKQSQIAQVGIDEFEFRYICDGDASGEVCDTILGQLCNRLGNSVQIILKKVEDIPRTKAGKFRAVINELPQDLKEKAKRNSSSCS